MSAPPHPTPVVERERDGFAPHFHAAQAWPDIDVALMRAAFAMRYDIYCLERAFLPADDYPLGLETDAHDAASAHFYALDRQGLLSGYVRLVPAGSGGRFPFQAHCQELYAGISLPPASESGEISRLMTHAQYRRRRGDTLAGVTIVDEPAPQVERRNDSPQIMLCMFRQMYAHCVRSGIRFWYAAMERPLARALSRMGFHFEAIGPETHYYGPVAPYLADLRELEAHVGHARPELLAWMRAALGQGRAAAPAERGQAD